MKTTKLHMIGNAHIDPVWLWQWHEGYQEVLSTFRSALDRMQEDPEFCFTASSAAFYAWVEQADPAMFAEIRARVAEGRWELAGGFWIEPDCNIPAGESFVRQALYGQRYFQEKFGTKAQVGYNPDSFGHNAVLPQILAKSGLRAYVFMRPGPHEKELPGGLFWWEADDGSRVLTFRVPFSYGSWGADLEDHVRRCAAEMQPPVDAYMAFYGVGDHGGGPTRENIASVRRLDGLADTPRLLFSTPGRFFDEVAARNWALPLVHDELQHHASGCYAAHSGIKRWNRLAENALLRAEAWSAVAACTLGQPYPAELTSAWRAVLFNQFHDIMAGTSLEVAYEDARSSYGEALAVADRAVTSATQALAWSMAIPQEDGTPLVVFNAHAWAGKVYVELEAGAHAVQDATLFDDLGQAVPFQAVQPHATVRGRMRIGFIADLPGLGYRVYRLRPAPGGVPLPEQGSLRATPTELENERFRLTFDSGTGCIISLYDKRAHVEVLGGPAARPVVIDDPSDTWSHAVFRFDQAVGELRACRMRVVDQGPVKAVLRVESAYGSSRLTQDFTVYRDLDAIDVHVTVDWHEHSKALKLRFPVNVTATCAIHEIPYGHIERPASGDEEPIQRWVDVTGLSASSGQPYGLSVLNDGKPSVDVLGSDIGLTMLRSPIYAHHVPAVPDPDTDYRFIDQGEQSFTYSLLPHVGGWEHAGTVRQATLLNQHPVAFFAAARPGRPLPLTASYLAVEPETIAITVLKIAEQGDALILRAFETTGCATQAVLQLPFWGRTIEAAFAPAEIKTWRVPLDAAQPIAETNLLEELRGASS